MLVLPSSYFYVLLSMHQILECSENYSNTSGLSYKYARDKPNDIK